MPIFPFRRAYDTIRSAIAFLEPEDSVARRVAAPDVERDE